MPTYLDTTVNDDDDRHLQWYLDGPLTSGGDPEGANVDAVTALGYTGSGIKIALNDIEAFDITHIDVDAQEYYAESGTTPANSSDDHGMWTYGVVGAENNSDGIVGVAYGATFALMNAFTWTSAANSTDKIFAQDADIVNSSFAPSLPSISGAQGSQLPQLIEAVDEGRAGLGVILSWAAGNSRDTVGAGGDNGTQNSYQAFRGNFIVGASNDAGAVLDYSDAGANVFLVAPGDNIRTTDLSATYDSDGVDYVSVGGTSFAAPVFSGVAALVLQANPALGYRDVQEIIALSSRKVFDTDASWQMNGAVNLNGGGNMVSDLYGFGLVDAHAAVQLALTWDTSHIGSYDNEDNLPYSVDLDGVTNLSEGTPNEYEVVVSGESDFRTQWVELECDITHDHPGDLIIKITSPSGVEHLLLDTVGDGTYGADDVLHTFVSKNAWGENPNGTWTISVEDDGSGATGGVVNSLELRFYGEDNQGANTIFYYNDDYAARVADDAGRDTLTDASGTDTINASMVTSNSTFYLAGVTTGTVDGEDFIVASGTVIENLYGGIGADTVYGNSANNIFHGGAGNDVMFADDGTDTLYGDAGNDTLVAHTVPNIFAQEADTFSGGDGNDTIYGEAADTVSGGAGTDTFLAINAYNLNLDVAALSLEYVVCDWGNDTITNASSSVAVQLFGSGGDDTLTGGSGNDQLWGSVDDDVLSGGNGNDFLAGQGDADTLTGGSGNDTFRFVLNEAHGDTITDFNLTDDLMSFQGYGTGGTFTNVSGNTWRISGSLGTDDVILSNGVTPTAGDWAFI